MIIISTTLFAALMSSDSVLSQLSTWDSPNIFQLLAVQASVAEAMERRWFAEYVRHLTVKEEAEKIEEEEMKLTCSTNSVSYTSVSVFKHFYDYYMVSTTRTMSLSLFLSLLILFPAPSIPSNPPPPCTQTTLHAP